MTVELGMGAGAASWSVYQDVPAFAYRSASAHAIRRDGRFASFSCRARVFVDRAF